MLRVRVTDGWTRREQLTRVGDNLHVDDVVKLYALTA